jgi:hypothetical protein
MASPKQKVVAKVKSLFGEAVVVEVKMEKPSPEESRRRRLPNGHWVGDVFLNGELIAHDHHWNKNRAYMGLFRGIEQAFEESLKKPDPTL